MFPVIAFISQQKVVQKGEKEEVYEDKTDIFQRHTDMTSHQAYLMTPPLQMIKKTRHKEDIIRNILILIIKLIEKAKYVTTMYNTNSL